MLNAKATQFSLSPEGFILWQSKPENPLPGEPVARLVKGEHVLKPGIEIIENSLTQGIEREPLKNTLSLWVNTHIGGVLETLVFLGLSSDFSPDDPVQGICKSLYDSLGVVPREDVEAKIAALDAEQRGVLRSKKVKLGPILVFMPLLNKPAAVRLRGLLWSLERGRALPAPVPSDGIVSLDIDEDSADKDFFRAVGYPIYGGRAVRIDMLDRVINLIYDSAEKGKFSAQHQMAEWLGCSIAGLYKILESMGHTKIFDPTDEKEKQETVAQSATEEPSAESSLGQSEEAALVAAQPAPQVKPDLAVFRLKRGKAFSSGEKREKGHRRRSFSNEQDASGQEDKSNFSKKGKFSKKDDGDRNERFSSSKKRDGRRDEGRKREGRSGRGGYEGDHDRNEGRVISFEVKRKEEDSPFAILQKLKAKSEE